MVISPWRRAGRAADCESPQPPNALKPILPLLLLCAALVLTGCGPDADARAKGPLDDAAGEIPFQLAGRGGAAVVLPVWVNGEGPFQFALDTGATFTCVDSELARRLALADSPTATGLGANAQGASRIRLLRADSVRVGGAAVEELTLCELDLRHAGRIGIEIDGLLGLNFLKPFHVSLDFQREVLHLRPHPAG